MVREFSVRGWPGVGLARIAVVGSQCFAPGNGLKTNISGRLSEGEGARRDFARLSLMTSPAAETTALWNAARV